MESETSYDIGSVFNVRGQPAMLVQTSAEKFCLVNLFTGNRLKNPTEVSRDAALGIPVAEIDLMAGNDSAVLNPRGESMIFTGRFKKPE